MKESSYYCECCNIYLFNIESDCFCRICNRNVICKPCFFTNKHVHTNQKYHMRRKEVFEEHYNQVHSSVSLV